MSKSKSMESAVGSVREETGPLVLVYKECQSLQEKHDLRGILLCCPKTVGSNITLSEYECIPVSSIMAILKLRFAYDTRIFFVLSGDCAEHIVAATEELKTFFETPWEKSPFSSGEGSPCAIVCEDNLPEWLEEQTA